MPMNDRARRLDLILSNIAQNPLLKDMVNDWFSDHKLVQGRELHD